MALSDQFNQSMLPADPKLAGMFQQIVEWWDQCGKLEPALADFLPDFIKAYRGVGLSSECQNEAYINLRDAKTGTYLGNIEVGPDLVERIEVAFFIISHEAVHAIQMHKAPCLHTGFGKGSNIVAAPSSYLKARDLFERQAYMLQGLFGYCLEVIEPQRKEVLEHSYPGPFGGPFHFRNENRNGKSIAEIIEKQRNYMGYVPRLYSAYYKHFAGTYKAQMDYREPDVQFVRLDDRDMLDIINAVGPKVTEYKPFYVRPPTYEDGRLVSEYVAELNRMAGIEDEDKLPTFREVLSAQGISPEEFLAEKLQKSDPLPEVQPVSKVQPGMAL